MYTQFSNKMRMRLSLFYNEHIKLRRNFFTQTINNLNLKFGKRKKCIRRVFFIYCRVNKLFFEICRT